MADTYDVSTDGATASGNNTTAVASNHVVQYPKPPRRDDGKWLSIGSMIGSLVGVLYNQDVMDDAKDAEDTWRDLTDKFKEKGEWFWDTHTEKLLECVDKMHEKLCAMGECGYQADFEFIRRTARADAFLAGEMARRKACRTASRYAVGMLAEVQASILRSEVVAATVATSRAVFEERQNAFKLNFEIVSKVNAVMEQDYMNRTRLGADLMASAGQNYGELAASLRMTAKEDVGDWALLGAALGIILPLLFRFGCPDSSYCGSC